MTQRRFNYTERQRLTGERCNIAVTHDDSGELGHSAEFVLDDLALPPTARVIVEAIHEHSYQRFDYGTIAEPAVPERRALDRFFADGDITFTVKVVEPNGDDLGLIVAESGPLRPEGEGDDQGSRVSILSWKVSRTLDQVPWHLELEPRPVLLVNDKVGDARTFTMSPAFIWLVFPAACREVLTHLLLVEDYREDDASDWKGQWIRFGTMMVKAPPPPSREDNERADREWIDDAVTGFCRRMRLWQDHGRHMFTGD